MYQMNRSLIVNISFIARRFIVMNRLFQNGHEDSVIWYNMDEIRFAFDYFKITFLILCLCDMVAPWGIWQKRVEFKLTLNRYFIGTHKFWNNLILAHTPANELTLKVNSYVITLIKAWSKITTFKTTHCTQSKCRDKQIYIILL